jgi:hypothetical protein
LAQHVRKEAEVLVVKTKHHPVVAPGRQRALTALAVATLLSAAIAGLWAAPGMASVDLRMTPARTFVTNGPVETVVPTNRAIYIAGRFTSVGPRTGPGVGIDASTASRRWLPEVTGGRDEVAAAVADGSGGFYVGGEFRRVGMAYRRNLVHILANGKVDLTFRPNPDGQVRSLAISDQILYVGGDFSSVEGQARNHIAAIDLTTDHVTSWDPDATAGDRRALVTALAVSGPTVYAGGYFSTIGGRTRHGVAALDAATGQATGWNPNAMLGDAGGAVATLAVSGPTVYAGGSFTSIGGQPRNGIAALDAATGDATSWDPDPNLSYSAVDALAVSGPTVYAGGDFTSIGGSARNHLAALDAATGQATSWNPNVQNPDFQAEVHAITVSGSTVYVGGRFAAVGGQTQNSIAALDASTGQATSWNPNIQGPGSNPQVSAIAVSGQTVYAGGEFFNSIGGRARNGLAALDPSTGWVTSWNPNPHAASGGGGVNAIAANGPAVYVGGWFNSIGGQTRHGLAALDPITGEATGWDPDVWNAYGGNNTPGTVNAIELANQLVYVGGYFTSVGGTPRTSLAAVDPTTGEATSWNPDPSIDGSCEIFLLQASQSRVYVGGWFDWIGGQARSRLAAVNTTTGEATGWNPNPQQQVPPHAPVPAGLSSLALSGQNVYVTGNFTLIGGQSRNGIAALDTATGDATSWDPNALVGRYPHPASVSAMAVLDSTVYVSGPFSWIGGQPRRRMAAVDASSGNATGWTPHPDGDARVLAAGPDGSLWAGGGFWSFAGTGSVPQSGIARFVPKP